MAEKKSNQGRNRPVTLRDIAKELGISHVTVSLALRDHPRISEATRAQVKKKAEEMGYQPDPMLSALSHYRLTSREKPVQATIAWVNPLEHPEKLLEQEEFALYWKGAEEIAQRLGFNLEQFTTQELSLARMDTIFKTRSIKGLLIAPLSWNTTPMNWDDFPWQDYAAVRFGRSRIGPLLHFVTSAQTSNTSRAVEIITQKGYRRIGFYGDATYRRMFTTGYIRAQQSLPEPNRLPVLYYGSESLEEKRSALRQWIQEHRPDAVMTDSKYLPELLTGLGYRIPEDIAVATTSIHDTPINAGIDQKPEEVGKAAVRMLASLINEHQFGIPKVRNQILVEGEWIDGSMLPDRNI